MKRSEMLDLIADIIHEHRRNTQSYTSEDIAEIVLSSIEYRGILPPLNDWSFRTDGDNAKSDNTRYHTWEPENETK